MSPAAHGAHCVQCDRNTATYGCEGCSRVFSFKHLADHRQELALQLGVLKHEHNRLRQRIAKQTNHLRKHTLIEDINQWEKYSTDLIHQTAKQARQLLNEYIADNNGRIASASIKLKEELKTTRKQKDFNEIYLNRLRRKLTLLEEQVNEPPNVSIQYDFSSFIKRISIVPTSQEPSIPKISACARWLPNGTTVAGRYGQGNALNQLHYPSGMYVDDDNEQTIYVADQYNHRIVEWKSDGTSGKIVAGAYGLGKRDDQLNYPTSVVVDKQHDCFLIGDRGNQRVVRWSRQNGTIGETIISSIDCVDLKLGKDGYLYVLDFTNQAVKRYTTNGTNGAIVAGGNRAGNGLHQFDNPYSIYLDENCSLYVSDTDNHRVMKWAKGAKQGIIVAGGQGQGNALTQLSSPHGINVDRSGTVYVADSGNDRVMRWCQGARQGNVVVGGNQRGEQANQLKNPRGLTFDRQGNLYIVDNANHRLQKFKNNETGSMV